MLPNTAITRLDLSFSFSEFDLAMSRKRFIGPRVFRPFLTGSQAADVGKIPLESLLTTQDDSRAPGGEYKGDDIEFSKFSYATDEKGRTGTLDDRTLNIFRDMIDAEDVIAQRTADIVLRNYEIACAAALYNTTTWTGAALTTAITHEFDDATNSVPITVIEAAKRKVRAGSGLEPNALICNRDQFWNMMNTAQVIDRLKYWGGDDPKDINRATASALFDLEHIIVAGGIKNTANKAQSVSISSVWSDENVMVCRVAETDDPQEPCIGRTFMFSEENAGVGDENELALIAEEYRDEARRSSKIRVRNDRDIVVMYPEAGHLLSNCVT